MLTFLSALDRPHPRALARLMWPDSPAWQKRTASRAQARAGALGATMPMKAATMLWRLRDKGLTEVEGEYGSEWSITEAGRRALHQPATGA